MLLALLSFVVAQPAEVVLIAASQPVEAGLGLLDVIVKGFQDRNWSLAIGAIFMLLVWLFNKLTFIKEKIPLKALPWVSMGMAVLAACGTNMLAHGSWLSTIVIGIQTGLMATGTWEALGKHVLVKKDPAA